MEKIHQSFESKMRQSSCTAQALKIWVTQLDPATRIVRLSPEWMGPLGKFPASSALLPLKGSLTRDFWAQVSPRPISIPFGAVLNFFENSRRYSRINVYRWCKRHRRKIYDTGDKFFIVDTGHKEPKGLKFITGVNDTADKCFGGVNDTGEYRVLPILACQHLKMKNKEKFNL